MWTRVLFCACLHTSVCNVGMASHKPSYPMPFHCPVFDIAYNRKQKHKQLIEEKCPTISFFLPLMDQATVCVLLLDTATLQTWLVLPCRRNYICTVLQNMFSYFALLSVEPCLSSLLLSLFSIIVTVTCSGGLNPVTSHQTHEQRNPELSGKSRMLWTRQSGIAVKNLVQCLTGNVMNTGKLGQ